jgi:hypothetical protein
MLTFVRQSRRQAGPQEPSCHDRGDIPRTICRMWSESNRLGKDRVTPHFFQSQSSVPSRYRVSQRWLDHAAVTPHVVNLMYKYRSFDSYGHDPAFGSQSPGMASYIRGSTRFSCRSPLVSCLSGAQTPSVGGIPYINLHSYRFEYSAFPIDSHNLSRTIPSQSIHICALDSVYMN